MGEKIHDELTVDEYSLKEIFYKGLDMKKFLIFILGFVLFFSGCEQKQENNIIKIGVVLPLTGNLAEPGKRILNGIKLAAEGLLEYKLIIEDSAADPKKSITAIKKLIHHDNVKIIIGDMTSSATLAIAPIAERNKVILLSPGASSPKLSSAGDYIFRDWVSDDFEGKAMANYAYKNIAKEASVVYIDNDYGIGLSDAFSKEFKKLGGELKIITGYNSKITDFKSTANKVIDNKIIYLPGEPIPNGVIVKTLNEQGYKGQILSNLSVQYDDFFKIAKKTANGIIYSSPSLDLEKKDKHIVDFVKKYKTSFGSSPDIASAHGYDAFNIIDIALKKCDKNILELKKCLYETNFIGVTGKMEFDTNGDVMKDIDIYIIENEKSKLIKKFQI